MSDYIKEKEDYVPIEKYTLILRHEYVDKDGKNAQAWRTVHNKFNALY